MTDGIIRAVVWLRPLLDTEWIDKLRGYHKIGETAVMPGAKLADLVTKHMRTVFTEHRKALQNDVDYSIRARDPGRCRSALQPKSDCMGVVTFCYEESIGTTGPKDGNSY